MPIGPEEDGADLTVMMAIALLRPTVNMTFANKNPKNSKGMKMALTRRIDAVSSKRPCPYMIATIWSANR